ncbi:unnamed protein product [Dovyalis caffra]|uniref:Uncharacterized protein n=1 Tax=Dovyalis caffra TaxID=77055 RepID=A0AAV1S7K6_9ROSI|nr:unnamed protein product [Dovyalis caffra]
MDKSSACPARCQLSSKPRLCNREHVELVVQDATVFLPEQPVTRRLAPATLA